MSAAMGDAGVGRGVGRGWVFTRMDGNRSLTFPRLEIIGLALTILVYSRYHRTRSDFLKIV
jgi:hypothetical protein